MDILEKINTWLRDPLVRWASPIVLAALYILFLIGRGVVRAVFFKGDSPELQSFSDEFEEFRNKPISKSESIGSISMRLGADIRNVWEMGYSDGQINDVLVGKDSLERMYKRTPEGNTKSEKGKEILTKKGQN